MEMSFEIGAASVGILMAAVGYGSLRSRVQNHSSQLKELWKKQDEKTSDLQEVEVSLARIEAKVDAIHENCVNCKGHK